MKTSSPRLLTGLLALTLLLASIPRGHAAEEEDKFGRMAVDVLVARPLAIGLLAVGSALFVVSLPFSAIGGNTREAAEALVVTPAQLAFTRPLGQAELR